MALGLRVEGFWTRVNGIVARVSRAADSEALAVEFVSFRLAISHMAQQASLESGKLFHVVKSAGSAVPTRSNVPLKL